MKIDYNLNPKKKHVVLQLMYVVLLPYFVQKLRVVWSGDLALNSGMKEMGVN